MLGEHFLFDGMLTGKKYMDLLLGPLFDFHDDHVPLVYLTEMCFQHDGALVHKVTPSRILQSSIFQDNIKSHKDVVKWKHKSPDLSTLGFFLWGFLKRKVKEVESVSWTNLQYRILPSVTCITPAILKNGKD